MSSLTKFVPYWVHVVPCSSKKLIGNVDADDYVHVRIAFCHSVREIQQDPVQVTAEPAGLSVDLAESC